jgi:hypothetical protein
MATVLEPKLARDPAPQSSDRNFGFVFAAVFTIIACWPLLRWNTARWWALGVAAVFALFAIIRPDLLHRLNVVWFALGRLLHRLVSPLIMGAIFFVCVTPIAWIMRLRGKDLLSIAHRPDLSSYWIVRGPSPPETETMKRQF